MKLPFEFGLPLIFRLVLPGTLLALLTFHTTHPLFAGTSDLFTTEALLAFQAIVYGWLIVIGDMHVYMLFEGRRYWPDWLVAVFLKDERNRLAAIRRIIKNGRGGQSAAHGAPSRVEVFNRRRRYLEASVDARAFSINADNGKYEAGLPTRLGNILLAFEGYSERVYGLDAIFFWPRLWEILDKDLRGELSTAQAMTDSAVYMSLVLYLAGLVNLAQYVVDYYIIGRGTAEASAFGLLGAVCLALGYWIYRASLQLHAAYGEQFKAAFDNFGSRLDLALARQELAAPLAGRTAKESNRIVWRYLHNYRVKDPAFRLPKRPSAWSRRHGRLDTPPDAVPTPIWKQIVAWALRELH